MTFILSKTLLDEKFNILSDEIIAKDKEIIIDKIISFEFIFKNKEQISLIIKNDAEKLIYDDNNNYIFSYKANLRKTSNPFNIIIKNKEIVKNSWKLILVALVYYIYESNNIEIYGIEMTKSSDLIMCLCIYSKKEPKNFILSFKKCVFGEKKTTMKYFHKKKVNYI